jgi:hypothetical protein
LARIDVLQRGHGDPAEMAIDALVELVREDPELGARIRQRLLALLD